MADSAAKRPRRAKSQVESLIMESNCVVEFNKHKGCTLITSRGYSFQRTTRVNINFSKACPGDAAPSNVAASGFLVLPQRPISTLEGRPNTPF